MNDEYAEYTGEYIIEVMPDGECNTIGRLIRCADCRHWKRHDTTARDALGYEWHRCPILKTETSEYDYCSAGRPEGDVGAMGRAS